MGVRRIESWCLALCLLSAISCSESSPPNGDSTEPSSQGDDGDDGDDGEDAADDVAGGPSTRGDASTGPIKSDAGSPKTDASTGGTDPQKDSGTTAPTPTGTDAAAADGGAPEDSGAGVVPDPAEIPAPVAAPLVWGFGIGITDVPAATKFYTEVMKMAVVKEGAKLADSTDTTLYSTTAMRGARLVLVNFDDQRNTRKITAKLVFQASSASAVNTAASKFPDYVSRLNFGVVQFDGPETYIHEVGGSFDSGGRGITVPYPIAMGFATSDLAASRKFYVALGMSESRVGTFSVDDVNGSGSISEYSVKFAEGSGVVLQQWTPMRNAKDNPIKLVIMVPDAKAMADKVVAAGGTIAREAERTQAYDNRLVIVAKDLDGYQLDLVQ